MLDSSKGSSGSNKRRYSGVALGNGNGTRSHSADGNSVGFLADNSKRACFRTSQRGLLHSYSDGGVFGSKEYQQHLSFHSKPQNLNESNFSSILCSQGSIGSSSDASERGIDTLGISYHKNNRNINHHNHNANHHHHLLYVNSNIENVQPHEHSTTNHSCYNNTIIATTTTHSQCKPTSSHHRNFNFNSSHVNVGAKRLAPRYSSVFDTDTPVTSSQFSLSNHISKFSNTKASKVHVTSGDKIRFWKEAFALNQDNPCLDIAD